MMRELRNDIIATSLLLSAVSTLSAQEIGRPMKDVQDNPFSWIDWYPVIAMAILFIALLVVIIVLWRRNKKQLPLLSIKKAEKPLLPHERALGLLGVLKEALLNDDEHQKAYYTQLTDVLRTYLAERYHIEALEMTTEQIVDKLRGQHDRDTVGDLRRLFRTADLVKFAKHTAPVEERIEHYDAAVRFVENTKPLAEEEEQEEIIEQPSRRWTWRQTVIVCLILAEVALLVMIGYSVYDLIA